MNILVVDNGSRHTRKIINFFGDDAAVETTTPDKLDSAKISLDTVVVLSGSSDTSVYGHVDSYRNEIDLIQNFGGVIVGICLGFQLIAHVYGSRLYKFDEKHKGIFEIRATDDRDLLLPEKTADVYKGHRWYVKDVSYPLVEIARSEDGIEIVRHASRPIYGMQFHPEVAGDNRGPVILHRIVELTTAENKHNHDII